MESSALKQAYQCTADREPVISIRDLSFSFENSTRQVLQGLCLDFRPGEFAVITGLSGCGKSTLALAMGGYIPQVIPGELSGRVLVKGLDTATTDLSDLAAVVSVCQQDPEAQLCTLTVFDEVAFGPENLVLPEEEVRHRVDRSLAAVHASELAGRRVNELSGGEKQRVAIASMLAMEPEVLVLDEPTSSLDPDSAADVLRAIESLAADRQRTVIVVEHRLDRLMHLADRLIVMGSGKALLDGRPSAVLPAYRQLLSGQQPPDSCECGAVGSTSAPGSEAIIEADGLRFAYGNREVLRGISFSARRGELVGVIGPNGSGKTTFLTCLTGLLKPSSGSLRIVGTDTARTAPSDIARKVGFVFQNPNHQIFESTVLEEVTFAGTNFKIDPGLVERSALASLARYGLSGYAATHPLRLSYGEKRRLNLGSVLPHDPAVIILDEPFTGQDLAHCSQMIADLRGLKAEGKTVLLVSHDMDLVYQACDRVVLFDKGRILVDATPGEAAEKIRAAGKPNYLPGVVYDDRQV